MARQNDNHPPGPEPGKLLVPSSHRRNELSNSILGALSRGDKRVRKCIPIPNGLGKKKLHLHHFISLIILWILHRVGDIRNVLTIQYIYNCNLARKFLSHLAVNNTANQLVNKTCVSIYGTGMLSVLQW